MLGSAFSLRFLWFFRPASRSLTRWDYYRHLPGCAFAAILDFYEGVGGDWGSGQEKGLYEKTTPIESIHLNLEEWVFPKK